MKQGYLTITKTAVLLIDMQEDFIVELSPKSFDTILPQQKMVINLCAAHNIPLVMVRSFGYGRILPELAEEADKVNIKETITKTSHSAFSDDKLQPLLQNWGINTLVLMGINATVCVRYTAESALELGYKIITAADLIAGNMRQPLDNDWKWYNEIGVYLPAAKQIADFIIGVN